MPQEYPPTLRTTADCIGSITQTLACLDALGRDLPDDKAYPLRLAAAHLQLARDLLDVPQPS